MTDRESIVAFIKQKIEAADTVSIVACQNLLAEIERCADLKPAKPKATIADLLALHDLDLGALAHVAGVIGDDLDDGDVRALCDKYQSVNDWHELVADVLPSHAATWDARQFSALGAKVRAALSAPTIKVAKKCGRYLGDNMYCTRDRWPGSDWCSRCADELSAKPR